MASNPAVVSYFANAQGGTFVNPNFSNVGGDQINVYSNPHWVLQVLWHAIADVGASHDSAARYPLIGCHPSTREEILEMLLNWNRKPRGLPFYWLYGPAGHGKSTIAQTLSELCAKDSTLVSSFFFLRNDEKRNKPTHLFLTIAYGLASSIPQLREIIGEVIQANPAVLRSSFCTQFRELVVNPCRSVAVSWESSWPRLVIIDGLDECQCKDIQEHILSILSSSYDETESLPLRFIICSRPEPTIREAFDSTILHSRSQRAALSNSWRERQDIARYLTDRFNTIRQRSRYSVIKFPDSWPPIGAIYQLADQSDGQFVYASIAVAFVDSEFHDPCRRLEILLRFTPGLDDESPFGLLDVLYHNILAANPNTKRLILILGFILHPPIYQVTNPRFIEILLGLPEGQVNLELCAMHSILNIRDSAIDILHTSFSDFLHDKSRSGDFYIDSTHFQPLTVSRALQHLNRYLQDLSGFPREFLTYDYSLKSLLWNHWADMCERIKYPTRELLSALESLELDTMYGVIVRGVIEDPERDNWDCLWRLLVGRIHEVSQWLRFTQCSSQEVAQNDIYHRVVSKFSAALEGFHVSLAAHSALSPALLLLGAYSKISGFDDPVSGRRMDGDLRLLMLIIKRSRRQITMSRQEHAQPLHVTQCRNPNCTSAQTLALVPIECSPGVSYVRIDHPPAILTVSLMELIPSDLSLQAVSVLFSNLALLGQLGAFSPLLQFLPRILPHILDAGEVAVWNLMRWLNTFPEESKRQTPITDLIPSIKDWVMRTNSKSYRRPLTTLRLERYFEIRDLLVDPYSFPNS